MLILSAIAVVLVVINVKSTPEKSESSSSSLFYVVPLGTNGGLDESDLSSYLLTTVNGSTPNSAYISLDSGTLRHGLE